MHQLLADGSEHGRQRVVADIMQLEKKGTAIYREGDRAEALVNIISGVVKAYKRNPNGTEPLSLAFLTPQDLYGLSEGASYVSSINILAQRHYLIASPTAAFRSRLSTDPLLEFHLIVKLCYELRQAQRHAFLLARAHTAKLAICIFKCWRSYKLPVASRQTKCTL